jgi:uncharacterized protein with PIN domain
MVKASRSKRTGETHFKQIPLEVLRKLFARKAAKKNPSARKRAWQQSSSAVTEHRCRACKTRLFLIRRHTSPPRLGPSLTTEFYRCDACESGYAFTPSTGKWKPWESDD